MNLDLIFNESNDFKEVFEEYCNLMHTFANFMPAPKYFNGSANKKGKGTWRLNNDYPYEYYKNLKDPNSEIYNREEIKIWLDENKEKYKISNMYELKAPYPISEYYTDEYADDLLDFIREAVKLIKNRAELLQKE